MLHFQLWKKLLIAAICLFGFIATLPNFFYTTAQRSGDARAEIAKLQERGQQPTAALLAQASEWPSFLPAGVVNLGLDLQGGSHFLLEVSAAELPEELLERLRTLCNPSEAGRCAGGPLGAALRDADIGGYSATLERTESGEAIVVAVRDVERVSATETALRTLATPVEEAGFGAAQDLAVSLREDGQTFELTVTDDARDAIIRDAVDRTIEVLRYRVDALGTREPTIARQGERRILLQLPGEQNVDLAEILRPSRLTFHMVAEPGVDIQDSTAIFPYSVDLGGPQGAAGVEEVLFQEPLIEGRSLLEANQGFDRDGDVGVNIRFDTEGSRVFRSLSERYLGRRFAIVLDGEIISAPVFRVPIIDGRAIITGSFTIPTAQALSINLSSGSLPADVTEEESSVVGPELGADSIAAGQLAIIVGFCAVLVWMAVSYGLFGFLANLSLLINVMLIFGALSMLGATLTLPGIAGIVLTIGMAVDANVLVFERIREELANGRRPASAIETGYSRAFSAIIDANVTTFMAAVILFLLGSGPVRGFAVTLGIGIITSVFTAVMLTRFFVASWFAWRRPKQLEV